MYMVIAWENNDDIEHMAAKTANVPHWRQQSDLQAPIPHCTSSRVLAVRIRFCELVVLVESIGSRVSFLSFPREPPSYDFNDISTNASSLVFEEFMISKIKVGFKKKKEVLFFRNKYPI